MFPGNVEWLSKVGGQSFSPVFIENFQQIPGCGLVEITVVVATTVLLQKLRASLLDVARKFQLVLQRPRQTRRVEARAVGTSGSRNFSTFSVPGLW